MTPPTRCELPIGWLNRKWLVHTVGRGLAPAKTYRFWIFWLNGSRSKPGPSGGGEPPPYGTSRQIPIDRAAEENRHAYFLKIIPEGDTTSHISYLISHIFSGRAPSATGDRKGRPYAQTSHSPSTSNLGCFLALTSSRVTSRNSPAGVRAKGIS